MVRRIAIVGMAGVVSVVIVAGGVRIHTLERRVAALEKSAALPGSRIVDSEFNVSLAPSSNQISPTIRLQNDSFALPSEPRTHQPRQIPEGATPHEINGLTYYVMPLGGAGTVTTR